LALGLVWLTVASGAVVLSEPAPFDVAMLGLIVLLPVIGLAVLTPPLMLALAVWLMITAGGLGAATMAVELAKPVTHSLITLYLSVAALILAGFISKSPAPHIRLVMNAYLWSAFVAALAGLAGYFDLLPGAAELFTNYARARGTFKDPNVYGAFLVPPMVYAAHLWLTRPAARGLGPLLMLMVLAVGILLSFSRGAWINMGVALAAFGYLSFATARSHRSRLKLALIALAALGVMGIAVLVVLQSESVSELIAERASFDQSYDHGPEGRFGGQAKAVGLIIENPFGIGAGEFGERHHHEDVHNVYYSMFLNAGWVGGFLYALVVLGTLLAGLQWALRSGETQGYLILAWSCLLAIALEGLVIDTDHWRHFFVLTGMVWGLIEGERRLRMARSAPMAARPRQRAIEPSEMALPVASMTRTVETRTSGHAPVLEGILRERTVRREEAAPNDRRSRAALRRSRSLN
jgi:O-antigen ligase